MTQQREMEQITEPQLRELYDYWAGKRDGRSLPSRDDILPEEIPALLPFMTIVDVLEKGRHFRFRMVGSDSAIGIDPTGKMQHEALPDGIYRDHIMALFRRGAAGPGALYSQSSYAYARVEGPRSISRLFLPLASDGACVDTMIIGAMREPAAHIDRSVWQANPPTITEEVELRLP